MKEMIKAGLMNKFLSVFVLIAMLICYGCVKESGDGEGPRVTVVSPLPCDTITFGEPFVFEMQIEGESKLGNLSIDIHHNFGQHSHGGHVSCEFDDKKDAQFPFFEEWLFALSEDKTSIEFKQEFLFDDANEDGNPFDTGDYHFHIYVTNQDGYLTFTTLDVKLTR